MKTDPPVSRRRFAQAAAAVVGTPWILPSTALGLEGGTAPSERITLGVIGLGGRNRSNLSHFLSQEAVRCLAVCDCFAERRMIGAVLQQTNWNRRKAAKILDVSYKTLLYKIKECGLAKR